MTTLRTAAQQALGATAGPSCCATLAKRSQGVESMEAKQTPLIELLERVPQDARVVVEHDQFSSSSHPVGRLCHEAAAALRAALAQEQPEPVQEPEGLDWRYTARIGYVVKPYTAPPRCPNCASLEAQNTELERKAAAERVAALYHPCTYILILGLKKLNAYDVLAEWDKARAEVDALALKQTEKAK